MDTIIFESGATFHFSAWSVDGSAPSTFVQVEASTPGVSFDLVNDTAGVFTSSYVIFSDAHASADALWTADATCEDWGGNIGLFDEDSPVVGDRVFFDPGETYNITGWSVDGALVTSNPPTGAHYLVAVSGGPFVSSGCVISHSLATPVDQWSAAANAFDAGNNDGHVGGNGDGGWFLYSIDADGIGCAVNVSTDMLVGVSNSDAYGHSVLTAVGQIDASLQCVVDGVSSVIGTSPGEGLSNSDVPGVSISSDEAHADATSISLTESSSVHADAGIPSGIVDSDTSGIVASFVADQAIGIANCDPDGATAISNADDVGAGISTESIGAAILALTDIGYTVLHVDVMTGTSANVHADRPDTSVIGSPPTILVEAIVRDVDGRRTRRIVEFRIQDLVGVWRDPSSVVSKN